TLAAQATTPPILLVVNASAPNPFGAYLGEILRAEGINTFQTADLSTVTSASLVGVPMVILAETPLTPAQATTLTSYVNNGGALIAMRPASQLTTPLGLSRVAGATTSEGYLLANAAHPVGAGIVAQTLQFHGLADDYTLNGASAVASL